MPDILLRVAMGKSMGMLGEWRVGPSPGGRGGFAEHRHHRVMVAMGKFEDT
jgi:hypothetical protein